MSSANPVVVPFTAPARARPSVARRLELQEGEVAWNVGDLPDAERSGEWLDKLIEGKAYEGVLLTVWTHHARTREQAEKLAGFITPMWPSPTGDSLLAQAIDAAGNKLLEVMDENTESYPRMMGAYLWALMSIDSSVARLYIRGVDREGALQEWGFFREPVLTWARRHGITQVVVSDTLTPRMDLVMGMRTHMMAAIADPVSIGYMLKYAPLG